MYELCSLTRWKAYSLAMGDRERVWRTKPFQMIPGGAFWLPPELPSDSSDSEEEREREKQKERERRRKEAKEKEAEKVQVLLKTATYACTCGYNTATTLELTAEDSIFSEKTDLIAVALLALVNSDSNKIPLDIDIDEESPGASCERFDTESTKQHGRAL